MSFAIFNFICLLYVLRLIFDSTSNINQSVTLSRSVDFGDSALEFIDKLHTLPCSYVKRENIFTYA